jgi:Tol biopolymer transport system component
VKVALALLSIAVVLPAASAGGEMSIPPASRSSVHGVIAYSTRGGDIWVMRADSSHRRRVTRARGSVDFDPDLSPDGRRLVFRSERGRQPPDPFSVGYDAIFVVRTDGKRLRQINPRSGGLFPTWSPKGNLIAFSGAAPGNPQRDDVTLMRPDGTGSRSLGIQGEAIVWSPDASRLAFASHSGDGNWAVWVMDADGSNKHQRTFPTLTPPAGQNGDAPGAWSPDGRRIAYSSVVGGDRELFVMNADGSGKRRLTHWRGGDGPNAWLSGGRIVFSHFTGSAPLPHWFVIRADGTGLRSLPWLYGAGDPIDWLEVRR